MSGVTPRATPSICTLAPRGVDEMMSTAGGGGTTAEAGMAEGATALAGFTAVGGRAGRLTVAGRGAVVRVFSVRGFRADLGESPATVRSPRMLSVTHCDALLEAAWATMTPGATNGSTQGRPTVPAAPAARARVATNPSHAPGRRRFFLSTGVIESPDDEEKTTPARVRSVPHEGHVSAEEYTGVPHIGQG